MTEINLKYGEYVQLDNMTGKYIIHRLNGDTEDIGSDGRMRLVYEEIKERTMTKKEAIDAGSEWMKETVGAGHSATVEEFCGSVRCLKYVNGRLTVMREFPYTLPRPIPPKGTPVEAWHETSNRRMMGYSSGTVHDTELICGSGKVLKVFFESGMSEDMVGFFENWVELEVKK